MPADAEFTVQIFGTKNSQPCRAADRFFKERSIQIHFVDLKQRPMAAGEIRRFIERYGISALLDTEGKSYTNAGMKYLKLSDAEILSRAERDPLLFRLPFIRSNTNKLSVGQDEAAWKAMLA